MNQSKELQKTTEDPTLDMSTRPSTAQCRPSSLNSYDFLPHPTYNSNTNSPDSGYNSYSMYASSYRPSATKLDNYHGEKSAAERETYMHSSSNPWMNRESRPTHKFLDDRRGDYSQLPKINTSLERNFSEFQRAIPTPAFSSSSSLPPSSIPASKYTTSAPPEFSTNRYYESGTVSNDYYQYHSSNSRMSMPAERASKSFLPQMVPRERKISLSPIPSRPPPLPSHQLTNISTATSSKNTWRHQLDEIEGPANVPESLKHLLCDVSSSDSISPEDKRRDSASEETPTDSREETKSKKKKSSYGRHMCGVCTKMFSTSSNLRTHMKIHSNEKPFKCGICGHEFTRKADYFQHQRVHSGG
ncbi:hypothetical protein BKA69DRAFT_1125384 [Paraphysoderma sedebokerense]|nr:hypothetical protein BKA69DRAFT_1125384 [Paraphysoderma sedebokerense]